MLPSPKHTHWHWEGAPSAHGTCPAPCKPCALHPHHPSPGLTLLLPWLAPLSSLTRPKCQNETACPSLHTVLRETVLTCKRQKVCIWESVFQAFGPHISSLGSNSSEFCGDVALSFKFCLWLVCLFSHPSVLLSVLQDCTQAHFLAKSHPSPLDSALRALLPVHTLCKYLQQSPELVLSSPSDLPSPGRHPSLFSVFTDIR